MLLYGWGVRVRDSRPLAPIRVYGPSRSKTLPAGDAMFHRQTTIHPERPAPGTTDLTEHILAGYASHLNVMPLDAAVITEAEWAQRAGYGFSGTTTAGRDGLRRTLHGEPVRFS
jgi:hypothetical protein